MGGLIDGFVQARLKPMMQTDGPIWRWNPDDPATAAFDPASPQEFAKAGEVRDLITGGLPMKVMVSDFGPEIGAVEVSSGGATYKFTREGNAPKPLQWSPGALPEASVALYATGAAAGAPPIKTFEAEGPWALFRLLDQATKENAGERGLKASFGDGARKATLQFALPTDRNPFSRGGLWSFRCPASL